MRIIQILSYVVAGACLLIIYQQLPTPLGSYDPPTRTFIIFLFWGSLSTAVVAAPHDSQYRIPCRVLNKIPVNKIPFPVKSMVMYLIGAVAGTLGAFLAEASTSTSALIIAMAASLLALGGVFTFIRVRYLQS